MTTTKVLLLLISFIISAVFVDTTSAQHHSFGISSSLDAQQWSGTWHHPANSPSPVWIPEAPLTTEAPLSWAGGESTSVRTVQPVHVHRIKTSTVFTSQVRLVTADRVPLHSVQIVKTLRPVSSVSSVLDMQGTRAPQPLTDIRQNFATKVTTERSAFILDNTVTTSERTSSVNQLKTKVPSRQTLPVAILDKQKSSVDAEDNTHDAVVNGSSSKSQASNDDITKSRIQSTHVTLPVISVENGMINGETKLVKSEHDLVSIEDNLRIGEVSVQVSDSEGSGIFDDQNDVSLDGRSDPLIFIETTGIQTLLPVGPPNSGEVTEGSGNLADTTPVVEPAPISWISEQFFTLNEATHIRSGTGGLSPAIGTQVPELSEDRDWTNRSEMKPLFRSSKMDGPFSTTTAIPVEFANPTTFRENDIGNVLTYAEKYKAGTSPLSTTVLKFSTTPRSTNLLISDVILPRTPMNNHEERRKYADSEEQKEPGSGDSMWPAVFQRPHVDIALSGSLPDTVADLPVTLSVLGVSNDTSTQSLSPANSPSLPSPNPYPDAPSKSPPTIAAEIIHIRKTAAAESNTSRDTGAEVLATGRSASSLDVTASSGARSRWLWAMMAPALLVLALLVVAVYWRRVRRRRRKLDISGGGGGGGLGAASPWSQPAQPVLHSSARTAFDPDESLVPPPPSYRQHLGVGATNAPSVSLELDESPVSSRQTSGTDVSTESA